MLQWFRLREKTDETADLETIYVEYFPKIWRYMTYRVGPDEAEDLTAEVFVRVMQNLDGRRESLQSWVYRIAHNLAIDYLKSARVRREIVTDPETLPEEGNGNDEHARIGLRMDLARALDVLTEDQREVISLKFFLGLDTKEIVKVTGRKPEAVRALQFRALAALRNTLHEDYNVSAS